MSLHAISPYSATWFNQEDEVEGYAASDRICLAPLSPNDFAAASEDGQYESTFRCRKCATCRNYDAWLLRRRLANKFKDTKETVWQVLFSSESCSLPQLNRRAIRAAGGQFLPGFVRLNSRTLVKLAVGPKPTLKTTGIRSPLTIRIFAVLKPWSMRAWRYVCKGLTEPRELIGAWCNRFYFQGLEQIKDQAFIPQLRGGIRKRHPEAKAGARAWRRGSVLYPSGVHQGKAALANVLAQKSSVGAVLTNRSSGLVAIGEILRPVVERHASHSPRETRITRSFSREPVAGSLHRYNEYEAIIERWMGKGMANKRPNDTS